MITNILASLIASFLFFLFGFSTQKLLVRSRLSALHRFWGSKPPDAFTVVVTTRPGPHPRSTPRVSLNEMLAYARLTELANSLGTRVIPIDSQFRPEDLAGRSVIVLGGPGSNALCEAIWRRIAPRLPFQFGLNDYSLSISDRKYIPEENRSGQLVKDFALLIRSRNPFSPDCEVLMCCGCHGYGTYGAVVAITDREKAELLGRRLHRTREFSALLEITLENGIVSGTTVRELFPLAPQSTI